VSGELSGKIDEAFENEKPRDYRSSRIGASIIGNPCEAYLAFSIRGFPELDSAPRFKRIFRDGHRIEAQVVSDLKKAGYTVHETDPMTGKQYGWDKFSGYMVYYADGIIEKSDGSSMLLEIKSMNSKLWEKFKKRGLAVSHPKYFDQLTVGMGYSGFKKAVLIAYNKDTSEYWDEVIEFDDIRYYNLIARGERVLHGSKERVADSKADWRCKGCPRKHVCWEGADVPKDKRTCAHSYPAQGGFNCSKGCKDQCEHWERFEPTTRGKP
jgi:hypothetical protein